MQTEAMGDQLTEGIFSTIFSHKKQPFSQVTSIIIVDSLYRYHFGSYREAIKGEISLGENR